METGDDGCEHVKYPKGKDAEGGESARRNSSGCDDEPLPRPVHARFVPSCGDPRRREAREPVDEPVEEPEPDTP